MNNFNQAKRFIFTGAPGCGKTSIIRALEMTGASVVAEAATDIIAYKQIQGESAPWEKPDFIEHTDARKISYEDALIFEQIHLDVYKEFGFEIVLVPKQSIAERCRFILATAGVEN